MEVRWVTSKRGDKAATIVNPPHFEVGLKKWSQNLAQRFFGKVNFAIAQFLNISLLFADPTLSGIKVKFEL